MVAAAPLPAARAFLHFFLPADQAAFLTVSRVALDLCRRQEVTATFFLRSEDLANRDLAMAAESIAAAGYAIGSSGATGRSLADLDLAEKEREIVGSREEVCRILGVDCLGFHSPAPLDFDSLVLIARAGYGFDCSIECSYAAKRRLEMERVLPEPFRPLPPDRLVALPLLWNVGTVSEKRIRRAAERYRYLSLILDARHCLGARPAANALVAAVTARFVVTDSGAFACGWPGSAPDLNPKVVLGISTTHETGAAIVREGRVLSAVSEERFSRVKQDVTFPPVESIREAIRAAGLQAGDIEAVAIAGLHWRDLLHQMWDGWKRDVKDFHGWSDYVIHGCRLLYRAFYFWRAVRYQAVVDHLQREYGVRPKVFYVEHHEAHAAAAYHAGGREGSLVVTADGVGDDLTVTVSRGHGSALRRVHRSFYPNSLGHFYTACTQLLGFEGGRHEGKITGLAGYGARDEALLSLVRSTLRPGDELKLDKRYYSEGIVRGFRPLRILREGFDLQGVRYRLYKPALRRLLDLDRNRRENIALAYQTVLEEEMKKIVAAHARPSDGPVELALSGGVFANVRLNKVLAQDLGVESVFVFPNMGDGGLCVGAALSIASGPAQAIEHVYLGPEHSDADVDAALEAWRVPVEAARCRVIAGVAAEAETVARLLAEGAVVARFAGRMEFGPRALGNRSILCVGRDPAINGTLNRKLDRTEFMPFAPMCLWEDADEYFHLSEGEKRACEFMTYAVDCREKMIRECPAAVHVDGTARPQLLRRETNPRMHAILRRFKDLTGVSCVINTSFNMHEEPIVCSPADALRSFLKSELEVLVLESKLVVSGERFPWL